MKRRHDPDVDVRAHLNGRISRLALARELRRAARPAVVLGALVAIAAATGFLLVRNISGGSPFADRYEVRVAVRDAAGVVPGVQEVRIAGVPVGRIAASRLVDGEPVLTLSIQKRFGPLYRDARLRLRPQTPLNDQYLDAVRRGTPSAGRLQGSEILPASRTQTAVPIGAVLDVFDPATRLRMQRAIDQLGRGLGDDGPELRATFVELAPFLRVTSRLTGEFASRRKMTARLVHNFGLILGELARRDHELRETVASGATTATTLADNGESLRAVLDELPGTLRQARATFTVLAPTLTSARSAFGALRPTADVLPASLESLRRFSRDAQPALRRLRPAVRALAPTFAQARPLSRRLADALTRLHPSAPHLDATTARLVPCLPAVRGFFGPTMSVFKFSDSLQAFPRGEYTANAPSLLSADASCAPGRPSPGGGSR